MVLVKKSSCRLKLTLHDDVIVAFEGCKFCAHVASFGEVQTTFAEVPQYANENKNFSMLVTAK